ncbi:class I adenylate-forming enzyme family protein [Boudabousia marimammalium]|uniref:AMP-dependent synthetase/ligase domain-containing protein n=1 Tax=Boudabousia marimammalium TaxID=156892 RepID=A0A1Q5PSS0_9ACTO|nr:AMP-binding protein [Boudabousia marimammalium]OKL50583.1 hypothetical protein BM477_01075 [Boudabousia marimammalium]
MNTAKTPQASVNPALTLSQSARRTPHRLSIVGAEGEFTVFQSAATVSRLAQHLLKTGINPSDKVALHAPNSAWHLFFFAACARIGAVFVPLNWRIPPAQAEVIAENIGCRRLFTPETLTELHTLVLGPAHTDTPNLDKLDQLDAQLPPIPTDDDAPILGMLTSGTTANPKQVLLSANQIFWAWQNFRDAFRYSAADTVLVAAPLSHIGGLNGTTNDIFVGGGTVIIEQDFNPERLLQHIEKYQVNQMFGVPTMYRALTLAPNWGSADLSTWRNPLIGGDTPSLDLLHALTERGLSPINVFGMTETGGAGFCAHTGHALTSTGMVGFPFRFVQARIVEEAEGTAMQPKLPLTDCADGQPGLVALRGPGVITAYADPGHTKAGVIDGWLLTGDIGSRDALGRYRILGRAADRIISGGENINPAEVEAALRPLPAFADCLVVGVPDEVWGEVVTVLTASSFGAEDEGATASETADSPRNTSSQTAGRGDLLSLARAAAESAGLPRFAWPKQVLQVDALPLNANGKPDRAAARTLGTQLSNNLT